MPDQGVFMSEKIVAFFARRHLLANFLTVIVIVGGVFFWQHTKKEQMPNISLDLVIVRVTYPGASPEEVEQFVTRPLEDSLKGISGIYEVTSSSNPNQCIIRVFLEAAHPDKDEAITEIRNNILDVRLPDAIIDVPRVFSIKSSRKDILELGIYHTGSHLMDDRARHELQGYALALENQLLNLPEVSEIRRTGWLEEEIQVQVYPQKLRHYEVSFSQLTNAIKSKNVRQPAGTIESKKDTKVTLRAELDTPAKLDNLIVQGGFEGQAVYLRNLARNVRTHEKGDGLFKINGHEGIMLRVVKSSSHGILKAMEAVNRTIDRFEKHNLKGSKVRLQKLDDESRDVRNRLNLIVSNGILGFILIIITLFVFLNFKSGIWVAMGIPFSFCFTMIIASLMGLTVNNITLAAVIIVMGMVVDDAIVVAENVNRLRAQGLGDHEAAVKGTAFVLLPIVGSVLTTCVAFIPLFFFTGRFGKMTLFIPPIIFLMLGGSLLESILILPSHLSLHLPRKLQILFSLGTLPLIEKYFAARKAKTAAAPQTPPKQHWFMAVENAYGRFLEHALRFKWFLFTGFIALAVLSGWLFLGRMKFVMFPREESDEVSLLADAPEGTRKLETAKLSRQLDAVFAPYHGKEVIGYTSSIARSRRGSGASENKMQMRIELVQKEKRLKSTKQLISEWNQPLKKVKGFHKIRFAKSRFGQDSGSPVEVIVQENNNVRREKIADTLLAAMRAYGPLHNVEIERPTRTPELRLQLNRGMVDRLSIDSATVGSTLRALLEGTVLYEFWEDDIKTRVRLTAHPAAKDHIDKVLAVPVNNAAGYLVPLGDLLIKKTVISDDYITRKDYKRVTKIFADIKDDAKTTPIDVAVYLEEKIFPEVLAKNPASVISFGGEILETRESRGYLQSAVIAVIVLIYLLLALLFNSLIKPLIIMATIPFGVVGIILAFTLHGINVFGFFAAVGALGLSGVVVNDSIVMIAKLDDDYDITRGKAQSIRQIADSAKTRLRAVILTTITTAAGLIPTAYGIFGYDAMLAEMMLAMSWGLIFSTTLTLVLVPCLYSLGKDLADAGGTADQKTNIRPEDAVTAK